MSRHLFVEPKRDAQLFDMLHGLFGIGDFDDSGPVPWFKFRMVGISKMRAIRKKRQLSFPALAMAARYCYRRHIPIKGVWELVAFIVPAAKAAGRDRVSPLGVEVREAVANERSREDPSPEWVDRLLRARGEFRRDVLDQWEQARS